MTNAIECVSGDPGAAFVVTAALNAAPAPQSPAAAPANRSSKL